MKKYKVRRVVEPNHNLSVVSRSIPTKSLDLCAVLVNCGGHPGMATKWCVRSAVLVKTIILFLFSQECRRHSVCPVSMTFFLHNLLP